MSEPRLPDVGTFLFMMRASLRSLVALASVAVLAACAHATTSGTGALSSAGAPVISATPVVAPPGGSTSPLPSPSRHGTPTTAHPATSTPSSAPPSSAAPQDPPSKVRHTGAPQIHGNYRISNFSAASCSWRVSAGAVQVNGLFEIVHTGLLAAGDVQYTASDDATGGYWIGTMQQIFWDSTQYPVTVGSYGYDDYAGKTITVTVTIQPTGPDDISTDNTAQKVIHVPAAATEDGAPGQHQFAC